jgi:hypothetical protein
MIRHFDLKDFSSSIRLYLYNIKLKYLRAFNIFKLILNFHNFIT